MSSGFIRNALRDIVPTLEEPYPKELVEYAGSLYSLSKVKQALNAQFEVARYHLCVYLTVEKFRVRMSLPEPSSKRIPIPERKLRSVVLDFRNSLKRRTMLETPPSTPRKRRRRTGSQLSTPSSTGRSRSNTMNRSSKNPYLTPDTTPYKNEGRIIDLDSPEYSPAKRAKSNSPTKAEAKAGSRKNLMSRLMDAAKEDEKEASPKKAAPKKPRVHHPKANAISTALLVSFCNDFYIPEESTKSILNTFAKFHERVKNPWGLLCGLVAITFTRLNSELVETRIGYKAKLYRNLQQRQNGGLKSEELSEWVKITAELCGEETWIKDLENFQSGSAYGNFAFGIPSLSSFVGPDVCYHSGATTEAFESWRAGIKRRVDRL